jgi:hypothetical protein
MNPEQRITMNMNNAVGLYTGSINVNEWKAAREKIRNVNQRFQQCSKTNTEDHCKNIFNINRGLAYNKGYTTGFDALKWSGNQLGSASELVKNATRTAFNHVKRAKCMYDTRDRRGGFGASFGSNLTFGIGLVGVGYQQSIAVGRLEAKNMTYYGAFLVQGGAVAVAGSKELQWSMYPSPDGKLPFIFGMYAGYGFSGWWTNATYSNFLGAFDNVNINEGCAWSRKQIHCLFDRSCRPTQPNIKQYQQTVRHHRQNTQCPHIQQTLHW